MRVILIKISQRLAKTSNLHPERLVLTSLKIQDSWPVDSGGFGDVYIASVSSHQVAAKVIRVHHMRNEEKIKVMTCFRRNCGTKTDYFPRAMLARPYFGTNYFIQMSSRSMAYLLWASLPEFALFRRGWKTVI
jgi:hypothetical protein